MNIIYVNCAQGGVEVCFKGGDFFAHCQPNVYNHPPPVLLNNRSLNTHNIIPTYIKSYITIQTGYPIVHVLILQRCHILLIVIWDLRYVLFVVVIQWSLSFQFYVINHVMYIYIWHTTWWSSMDIFIILLQKK